MTQVSQPRRHLISQPSLIPLSNINHRGEYSNILALPCRVIFERLREQLIETHYNWFIAIDPESKNYWIDQTFPGINRPVCYFYGDNDPKLTIFRLNETGTCCKL
ncbi:hypothetical protein [Nostoc sp. CCY0012]|uniref:hypothetical protein n=1 Tax=Nostoc sp. CCY0012 TaxID=1056123 RepID=UPI0039C685FE